MSKINFQNLPNTTTPVNATNLNSIQAAEIACFRSSAIMAGLASGSSIPLTITIRNSTGGKVTAGNDGKFTINYTGFIKVSFNLWIYCQDTTARPWIRLYRNTDVFADVIDDIMSGFNSYTLPELIMPVTSGDYIQIKCETQSGQTFDLETGKGNLTSYITIELL